MTFILMSRIFLCMAKRYVVDSRLFRMMQAILQCSRTKGKLPSGYDFWLNSIVDNADFLITIGVVMPHYFAGFSGGRKSILPGVVGKQTVERNHARMVEIMDNLPPIRENPISLEMIHAARIAGVDFILNVRWTRAKT